MATKGGETRNYLLDFYIAGFFFDQILGLAFAYAALRIPEILFFLTPFRLLSVGVAGLALWLTLHVVISGLDKKLLVLPAYHLGGLAVMEMIGSLGSSPPSGDLASIQSSTLASPALLWASLLHSAVGLIGGAFWLHWSKQVGETVTLESRRPTPTVAPAPRKVTAAPVAAPVRPPVAEPVRPSVARPVATMTTPRPTAATPGPTQARPPRPVPTGPASIPAGAIAKAAEESAAGGLLLAKAGLILALLILGLNWKYFYNVARGPQVLTGALLKAPGATRAVKSEAPALLAVEETSSSSVRLGRRGLRRGVAVPLPGTKTYFYVARIDDVWVLVKTRENKPVVVGFSGELAQAPTEVVAELTKAGDWDKIAWMVDTESRYQTPGFWSAIGLLLLGWTGFKTLSLSKRVSEGYSQSPELAPLKTLGPLPAVLSRIEREINAFGGSARVGKWWVTPQWIVTLDPAIVVIPSADLVAAAPIAEFDKKSGELKRAGIGLWTKSKTTRTSIWMEKGEILMTAQAVLERLPWAWLTEAGPFEDRWKGDRPGCVKEAESRRRASQDRAQDPARQQNTAPGEPNA